jgi:hypothetical protein
MKRKVKIFQESQGEKMKNFQNPIQNRFCVKFIALTGMLILSVNFLAAQSENTDDAPYLSDDDIKTLEIVLPDDVPEKPVQISQPGESSETLQGEMNRLNNQEKLYQLIILDRKNCSSNADIGGISDTDILYKFAHLENGYLLILYKIPAQGPVFPVFPKGSYIILDLLTYRISTIKE